MHYLGAPKIHHPIYTTSNPPSVLTTSGLTRYEFIAECRSSSTFGSRSRIGVPSPIGLERDFDSISFAFLSTCRIAAVPCSSEMPYFRVDCKYPLECYCSYYFLPTSSNSPLKNYQKKYRFAISTRKPTRPCPGLSRG